MLFINTHLYTYLSHLHKTPDYKESFECGNPLDDAQPNIWPPESTLPGFQEFMQNYFKHCASLVHTILSALSLALDLPQNAQLSSAHSQSRFQLRLLHYPSIAVSELANNARSRINAHSDFGTLTLLWQDAAGGLEIEDPHTPASWRAAPPVEGAVLVNVGDLLARWSNDRWRSTVHRVGLPRGMEGKGEDGEEMVPDRYSIPFFATANMDTVVEALPGCWDDAERPKKYEAVTAWEYVQMRMAALYD
jgi:isopenicillin N synthase-like dioxygenase